MQSIGVRALALGVVLALAVPAARADTAEQREFSIWVDGKESGRSTMTLIEKDDGTAYMKANVNVRFRKIIRDFEYALDAEEWWKGGRLIALKSNCVDNGKRSEVQIAADADGLRVRTNNVDRRAGADAWTTSYWKLLDPKFHNKAVAVIETDTGKELSGTLQLVGTEQLTVGDQPIKCFHFRVAGTDLWFDQHHRLVRQEFVDTGFRTIVMLSSVKRN